MHRTSSIRLPDRPQNYHPWDFYLSRARLARRGFKVLVVLDRFEMPLTRAWEPVRLSRAKAGRHHISVDLLDRMGLKVHGALNQTDRTFHVK